MAAVVRLPLTLHVYSLFLLQSLTPVYASLHPLLPRARPLINNITGHPEVFNPTSQQLIPQEAASDGSGTNFSLPATLWIVFCFLVGVPLALAGIRGWRFTTGAGIGLATAVCSWAAIISSVSSVGVSDVFLVLVTFAFFFLGFILGLFEVGRVAGIALLGITGGLAFGIRIAIIKPGLLIQEEDLFFVNWVIVTLLGLVGGLIVVWSQRVGITVGSASAGTFLVFLGVDLVINKQAGMSRGLRFLFDRNASHILDIIQNGYEPSRTTRIIIITSLSLTPILAYAQHKVFSKPFSPLPRPHSSDLSDIVAEPTPNKIWTSHFSL